MVRRTQSRRALILFDERGPDEGALEWVLRWAGRRQATVVGMAVIDERATRKPEPIPIGASHYQWMLGEYRIAQAREQADASLDRFEEACAGRGVSFEASTSVGQPIKLLQEEIQRHDMLVCARPRGRWAHWLNEGFLESLIRRSPRPIVVVPPNPPMAESAVVAFDGSTAAARALQVFSALEGDRLPMTIVTVFPSAAQAERVALRAQEYLLLQGVPASSQVLVSRESPEKGILKTVETLSAEILVMGAFGHSRLRELIFGSVTRRLLRRCPVPIFMTA